MVFFSFPFSPRWGHRREGMAGDGSLAPQPNPLSITPGCFLQAEPSPQLLTPRLNWFQTSARGMHKQWALFWDGGLLALSFNRWISLALEMLPLPSTFDKFSVLSVWNIHYCLCETFIIVCMECPLLSIWNVCYCLFEMFIWFFFFFERQYTYIINAWTAFTTPSPVTFLNLEKVPWCLIPADSWADGSEEMAVRAGPGLELRLTPPLAPSHMGSDRRHPTPRREQRSHTVTLFF